MKQVLYTAAHGGFALDRVPLGGGAAVCAHLVEEWRKTRPFPVRLLSPDLLGDAAPQQKDLVRFSERQYARFCEAFETKITAEILRYPSEDTIVLSNDICEGPDFRRLAEKGYPIFTIYHVDVIDYFLKIYGRGLLRPETATQLYEKVRLLLIRWLDRGIWQLLFEKQRDSVFYSQGVIVPSEEMKSILRRCYPTASAEKIHVLPWGIWQDPFDESAVQEKVRQLREQYPLPPGAHVLLTLSRISPEKGQDRLLRALALWERRKDFPAEGLCVFICGEAAFMRGERFLQHVRRLAGRLQKTRVIFPGFVAGALKQAFFRLADLYVFPSRHESYGLTLLEALQAGLPAVACANYGTRESLRSDCGEIIPSAKESKIPVLLQQALQRLLSHPDLLQKMRQNAKSFAAAQRFSNAATRLAELIAR